MELQKILDVLREIASRSAEAVKAVSAVDEITLEFLEVLRNGNQ